MPGMNKYVSSTSTNSTGESEIKMSNNVKNRNGNIACFGSTGKYYCGKKNLIGRCGCCDGCCGPTNGENCDACMELDLKRFNLMKGFLINPNGNVSKLDPDSGDYYCGRRGNSGFGGVKFCQPGSTCSECYRVKRSINIGRYKSLIWIKTYAYIYR